MPTPPDNPAPPRRAVRLTLDTHLPPLSGFTPTKDIRYHPLFRGLLFPWVWRVLSQRLTRAGHYFLIATTLFMAFGAVSLDQQWYVPFTYAFGLWVVALVSMWAQHPRVSLRSSHADRVRAGDTLPVEIEVEAWGRRAVGLTVLPDRLPPAVDAVPPDGVALPVLLPGEKAWVRLGLLCPRRGAYALRGFRVETAFPLGLMVAQQVCPERRRLLVHPRFTPLSLLDAPPSRRYQPGEAALSSRLGDSLEFIGNREYREGDPLRSINWRATARLSRPVVREYREEYSLHAALILDTHVPMVPGLPPPPAFERAVSLAAAVGEYLSRSDYRLDLLATGADVQETGAVADDVLDALATVAPDPSPPWDALEDALADRLRGLTLAVCVLLDWDVARRDFVARLGESGAGVKAVVVRDSPCALPPGDVLVLTSAQVDAGAGII